MTITRKTVADKIAAYLHHELTLADLVDWAEMSMVDSDFTEKDSEVISNGVMHLGVADVRAFGLSWEDCEGLLKQLGFSVRVDVVAA